ncbi:hypothetical protein [Streptomyces sp. PT12]|uniref:hypothetical protein n=1 Tax=Streptomyces sp. PT12 TaxID=1510197 RepID=UPI0015EF4FEF|nr:hypothetical protein [Streptomyces sp. PT12]
MNRPTSWSTQIVGTTAGVMISPDSTRNVTGPASLPLRRCGTNATIEANSTIAVTLATVRTALLMKAMINR